MELGGISGMIWFSYPFVLLWILLTKTHGGAAATAWVAASASAARSSHGARPPWGARLQNGRQVLYLPSSGRGRKSHIPPHAFPTQFPSRSLQPHGAPRHMDSTPLEEPEVAQFGSAVQVSVQPTRRADAEGWGSGGGGVSGDDVSRTTVRRGTQTTSSSPMERLYWTVTSSPESPRRNTSDEQNVPSEELQGRMHDEQDPVTQEGRQEHQNVSPSRSRTTHVYPARSGCFWDNTAMEQSNMSIVLQGGQSPQTNPGVGHTSSGELQQVGSRESREEQQQRAQVKDVELKTGVPQNVRSCAFPHTSSLRLHKRRMSMKSGGEGVERSDSRVTDVEEDMIYTTLESATDTSVSVWPICRACRDLRTRMRTWLDSLCCGRSKQRKRRPTLDSEWRSYRELGSLPRESEGGAPVEVLAAESITSGSGGE